MEQIEQTIVRGLLYNEEYARKVYPHLSTEYFDGALGTFFNVYSDMFEKYHKVPSLEALVIRLQNDNVDDGTFETLMSSLESAHDNREDPIDPDWLKDETESYCSDKAIYNAIMESVSIIEGKDTKRDRHSIPELLTEAVSVSFDSSIGADYFSEADIARRYHYYTSEDTKIPFALKAVQRLSNGGLPPKTLTVKLAGTNVGKSAWMCFEAGEMLRKGYNVLYISMEMAEEAMGSRIDANLLDIKTDDLKKFKSYEEFQSRMHKLQSATNGKLFIKEYPPGGAHAGHFRNLMKELSQKKKFKPDIVFIDYVNICASSRYRQGSGVNSYTYVKAVAEELRGLAVEFEVPVVTATQTNREGFSSQAPDLTSTSESFGLPQTADFMFAAITNEQLMEEGKQIFHLLKTRFGNKKSAKAQMVKVDFDKMRYYDMESETDYQETVEQANHTKKPDTAMSGNSFDNWDLG